MADDPYAGIAVVDPYASIAKPAPPQAAPAAVAPPAEQVGPPEPLGPPASAAPPSLVDKIMSGVSTVGGVINQGVKGAGEGIADVIGLPGTLAGVINGGINAAGGGLPQTGPNFQMFNGIPMPTGEGLKKGLDYLNDTTAAVFGVTPPRKTPDGMAERVANRVGQEAGAMLVPVGGAVKAGAGLTAEAARALIPEAGKSGVLNFIKQAPAKMVESAVVDRGKFIGKEVGAAAAAGSGAAGVNEVTGKSTAANPTVGQQAGDLAGAVGGVGLASAVNTGAKAVGHLWSALRGKSTNTANEVIRDVSTDEIARAAGLMPNKDGVIDTDPLARAINEGTKVSDTIPGFRESTADRTKNEGLANMEFNRAGGADSGAAYKARKTANVGAIDDAMNKSEPGGTVGALSKGLTDERDRQLLNAAIMRGEAENTAAAAVRPLAPQGTASGRGNTIRTEVETARDTAREATADAYGRARVDENVVNPQGLTEALDAVDGGLTQVERTLVPRAKIDAVRRLGETPEPTNTGLLDASGQPITRQEATSDIQLREATTLRSELQRLRTAALADPKAENGGRNAARVLGRYLDAVESFIQRSATPEQRTALQTARETRFAEGEAFGRRGDPVAEILGRHQGGEYKKIDENVAGLATKDHVMARLLEEADTPATRDAIRNQLLSNADTASEAGLQRFQQQYGQQIARFPGLGDELGTATRARGAETAARGAEDTLQKTIGKDGSGTVATYLRYADERAEQAMGNVLKSHKPAVAMDDLLTFVGDDPKAVEGARKAFWNIMQDNTRAAGNTTATMNGVQPFNATRLNKFIEKHETAAARLYRDNPEHWANIKKVAETLKGVDVRDRARAPGTSGTAQILQGGGVLPSSETVASRVFAVERGVVSPAFAAINIAGIIARKAMKRANSDAISKTIDKALLEPDFAAALLKENNPANRAALRRATKGWQAHEASTFLEMLQPDDKDTDTKKAVMK